MDGKRVLRTNAAKNKKKTVTSLSYAEQAMQRSEARELEERKDKSSESPQPAYDGDDAVAREYSPPQRIAALEMGSKTQAIKKKQKKGSSKVGKNKQSEGSDASIRDSEEDEEEEEERALADNQDVQTEDFSREIDLKEDHIQRPLLLVPNCVLYLEAYSKLYRKAYEFVQAIADPITRPQMIHTYKLTKYSLYTAMVLQYKPQDIIAVLKIFMKNRTMPASVEQFILENTNWYGSARFFLKNGDYYLDILENAYKELFIERANMEAGALSHSAIEQSLLLIERRGGEQLVSENKELAEIQDELRSEVADDSEEQGAREQLPSRQRDEAQLSYLRFRVVGDHFRITEAIISRNIPLIQEYDFLGGSATEQLAEEDEPLEIELRGVAKTRYYQDRAIKNIFIQDKARSGIVILPCGAGKTVVGIVAVARVKRSCVIICEGDVSVEQWRDELERWTTVNRKSIIRLTGRVQDKWEEEEESQLPEIVDPVTGLKKRRNRARGVIIITTYSMITKARERSEHPMIARMKQRRHWGTCIIDEVHKLPARTFQNVLRHFKFSFKLGLTATPYREDDKINNLFFMIGPKLYEENWLDLVNQGFLAKPYCVEIRCPMSQIFASEYEKAQRDKQASLVELLHTANPCKFLTLQYLIQVHEERGDKIMVFCDRPRVIETYARLLGYPVIHGEVAADERRRVLNYFKQSQNVSTVFVSRVGDTAIDLPQANVGIQIGVHYKSRRQEVQRLGRIMRPKENSNGEYNAFFYTLVSEGTAESQYCWFRQKCLIDQGFRYEIVDESGLPYRIDKKRKKFQLFKSLDEREYLLDMLAASNQVFVPDAFKEAANQDGGGGGKDRSARAPPKIEVFE